jgi:hypothetical protein
MENFNAKEYMSQYVDAYVKKDYERLKTENPVLAAAVDQFMKVLNENIGSGNFFIIGENYNVFDQILSKGNQSGGLVEIRRLVDAASTIVQHYLELNKSHVSLMFQITNTVKNDGLHVYIGFKL